MFIIAKGECTVNVVDERKREDTGHRILRAGDYFGEIALLYGCQRTSTVISTKYSTLATLTRPRFKEISTEFPELIQ